MALNLLHDVKLPPPTPRPLWPTVKLSQAASNAQPVPAATKGRRWSGILLSAPGFYVFVTVLSAALSVFGSHIWSLVGLAGLVVWPAMAVMHFELSGETWPEWRRKVLGVSAESTPRPAERFIGNKD